MEYLTIVFWGLCSIAKCVLVIGNGGKVSIAKRYFTIDDLSKTTIAK